MRAGVKELADLVATAREATAELDDADLRRTAFERVLDHLLRNGDDKELQYASVGSAPRSETSDAAAADFADEVFADEQQRVDEVSRYFKIEPEDVGHIFDLSSDEPELAIHSSKLDAQKSPAVREICLLVAGARTALGQDTATSHIKSAADHYGRLDTGNFMKTLSAMPEISVLGKPGSPNRVVRMKALGAEMSQAVAQRLLGE